jgi:hypothetical protein
VLTPAHALALAGRHQHAALRDAAAFATAMGQSVAFLCRRGPEGVEFEAVALDSARTCAIVDAEGRLRYVAAGPRDPWERAARASAATTTRTGPSRIAEQALAAAARPR